MFFKLHKIVAWHADALIFSFIFLLSIILKFYVLIVLYSVIFLIAL